MFRYNLNMNKSGTIILIMRNDENAIKPHYDEIGLYNVYTEKDLDDAIKLHKFNVVETLEDDPIFIAKCEEIAKKYNLIPTHP